MRLKEDNAVAEDAASEEESIDHTIHVEAAKIMYTEAPCAGCFAMGMVSLMNLGSTFADYVSVVTGIDGIEAIIIPQGIFEVIELPEEPETYLDDVLTHFKADEEADTINIVLSHFSDPERVAILSTIKAYFKSADNGYKPSKQDFTDAKSVIGISSDDLPKVVRDALDQIIKKHKGK